MRSLITFFIFLFISLNAISQSELPDVKIKNMQRETVEFREITQNDSGPVLICFWATWCKPCIKELNSYNQLYPEWKKKTGVKILLVSIDNARSMYRVAPFVNGKGWDFNVYIDVNSELKRAMNVVNIPHTFIINNGKIKYQHTSYMPGDEKKIFEKIKSATNK